MDDTKARPQDLRVTIAVAEAVIARRGAFVGAAWEVE